MAMIKGKEAIITINNKKIIGIRDWSFNTFKNQETCDKAMDEIEYMYKCRFAIKSEQIYLRRFLNQCFIDAFWPTYNDNLIS